MCLDDHRSRRWSMDPARTALWHMCDPPDRLTGSRTDLLMLFSSDSQGLHCSNLLETAVRMTAVHVREASHTHRLRTVSRVRGRSRPPSVSREREGSCYPHERTMGRQRHPALQQLAGVKFASRKSFGVMALTKLLVRDAHSTQAHRSTMRKRLNMHML